MKLRVVTLKIMSMITSAGDGVDTIEGVEGDDGASSNKVDLLGERR